MTQPFSSRLTALDASFLDIETETAPMHVGAALLFDARPLTLDHGGLDFERLLTHFEASLEHIPRYRQKLTLVPGFGHPIWVDDPRFNIRYHVRHTRLPLPGTERSLKRLVGRLFSQHLDRSKPMWESWIVEGIEGNRFALVLKAHHCMVDGVAGVELLQALLRPTADASNHKPKPWTPRPAPSRLQMVQDEVAHHVQGAKRAREYAKRFADNLEGLRNVMSSGLRPSARTPFTEKDVSPYRRFDWTDVSLKETKAIKNALGGTVNDVIVATTAGAVRRFLMRRGFDVEGCDNFRTVLPVNTRHGATAGAGNHVAMLLAELPISEPDPERRMQKVIEITTRLKKESNQVGGAEFVEDLADVLTKRLLSELFKTSMRVRTYNMIITNIPGPPFPLYLFGAKLDAVYPMVPLMQNQNLGIALFSYLGKIFWGFNADWESFPDAHEFVEDIQISFEELRDLAHAQAPNPDRIPMSDRPG